MSVTELRYSTVISPNDHAWITGEQWYFDVGRSALDCIKSALTTAHIAPTSILDLPCGHGRICRMLRALFPDAHLAACDLDRDAVDFCAAQFNATPVYSHEDIRRVSLDQCFDLIWCGSLFTHRMLRHGRISWAFLPSTRRRVACSSSPPMDGSRSSGCEKVF
jgi:SAM-dependent methyltransferase